LLLENGAQTNQRNEAGFTALHVAIMADDAEFTTLLLDKNADPHSPCTEDRLSPLALCFKDDIVRTHALTSLMKYYASNANNPELIEAMAEDINKFYAKSRKQHLSQILASYILALAENPIHFTPRFRALCMGAILFKDQEVSDKVIATLITLIEQTQDPQKKKMLTDMAQDRTLSNPLSMAFHIFQGAAKPESNLQKYSIIENVRPESAKAPEKAGQIYKYDETLVELYDSLYAARASNNSSAIDSCLELLKSMYLGNIDDPRHTLAITGLLRALDDKFFSNMLTTRFDEILDGKSEKIERKM
jgi:ankyrin repeat protein